MSNGLPTMSNKCRVLLTVLLSLPKRNARLRTLLFLGVGSEGLIMERGIGKELGTVLSNNQRTFLHLLSQHGEKPSLCTGQQEPVTLLHCRILSPKHTACHRCILNKYICPGVPGRCVPRPPFTTQLMDAQIPSINSSVICP